MMRSCFHGLYSQVPSCTIVETLKRKSSEHSNMKVQECFFNFTAGAEFGVNVFAAEADTIITIHRPVTSDVIKSSMETADRSFLEPAAPIKRWI